MRDQSLDRHPELAGLFEDVLLQLESDPHAPKLRLRRLKGKNRPAPNTLQ